MTTKIAKLRGLLREIFQLDQADLDFGIYRIMNQKRDEVERFLDDDLLPQVKAAFEKYRPADKAAVQAELGKRVDVAALEDEVFSDLFTFFRRYYHGGDFLSLRRYKAGVYAIPYEGEEVKLHWANRDQYYIKSSEHLSNYAFKVGTRTVRFELAAASTERDNNKAQNGNERRFILAKEDAVSEAADVLIIRFEYRPDAEKRKQEDLNADAAAAILEGAPADWRDALRQKDPTKANPDRTVLEKHLCRYTARNTFDYFIHKDLGGFLRRELDFFIKNEVLLLDDIDQVSDFAKVEEKLSKIRVLRAIAHKIIEFVSQLEDFQKKLWLKKKFVVETSWCITLDRIPEEFYPEIAANDAQRQEWVRLFAIDIIGGDILLPAYSEPLSVDFLKSNQGLLIDTGLYPALFAERVLSALDDSAIDGANLLMHSDNLQALNLLSAQYCSRVEAVFIDPPYNTGNDGFVYKDGYQSASWLTLMNDRLELAKRLLALDGSIAITIDRNEDARLRLLCDAVFGSSNFVATIAWQKLYTVKNSAKYLSEMWDSILVFARSKESWRPQRLARTSEQDEAYGNPDDDQNGPWISNALQARNYYSAGSYSITTPSGRFIEGPPAGTYWRTNEESFWELHRQGRVWWGKDGNSLPRIKKYLKEMDGGVVPADYWLHQFAGTNAASKTETRHMLGQDVAGLTPKPVKLLRRLVEMTCRPNGVMLDFFAGSGSTGEAIMRQNEADDGHRRFVLVESGAYFDCVMKPRLLKAAYSADWKDGQPIQRVGGSHCFKCVRLESYEDTLDNLELRARTGPQQRLLGANPQVREDYMLSYMLDIETRGSASLLNVEQFRDPFNYKLKVTQNNETLVRTIDLIETFNYLIGLRVEHMQARVHRTADFERDEHGRLQIKGNTKPCNDGEGWTFRVVQGRTADDRVLVIWRVLTDDPEKDNLMLDTFCTKMGFSIRDMEFDLIYVNGDNNLENLRRDHDTWKVQLIEENFHRLMFESADA